MAHTQCQGFSKCPSYISQNKHFSCATTPTSSVQCMSEEKSPVTVGSLLQSPTFNCLQDKASVSSEERFKPPPINRKNTDVDWHKCFSQSTDYHKLNLCCIPLVKQSRISILRYTPQVLHLDKFGYTWCTQYTNTQAKKLNPSTTEEQPQTMNVSQGTFLSFTGLTCQLLGCSSNPVTELNWLVMEKAKANCVIKSLNLPHEVFQDQCTHIHKAQWRWKTLRRQQITTYEWSDHL